MRLRKKRRTYGTTLNIAPLIDVVFLLIIFFMVVTQFTSAAFEDMELPVARSGERSEAQPAGRLVVNVHADGRLRVMGQDHTPESLQALLSREREAHGPDRMNILVRGDRLTPWRKVAPVLAACAALGIKHVRVAVNEPGADASG